MVSGDSLHIPVLPKEVSEMLRGAPVASNAPMLDCTLGGGGHSQALLEEYPDAKLIALDCDAAAIERSTRRLERYSNRFLAINSNFSELRQALSRESKRLSAELQLGSPLKFARVIADFGYSSDQLEDSSRGLSFSSDGPLDMRLDPSATLSAERVVNEYSHGQLAGVFKRGGVGKLSGVLASEICKARPVKGTRQLASICESVLIRDRKKDNFSGSKAPLATVPFQAIRIEVNQELKVIRDLLEAIPDLLLPGGRFAAICFHSLEDQLVARAMRDWERPKLPPGVPVVGEPKGGGKLLTRKAITASEEELQQNSRARSARLRVFEKGESSDVC